MLRIKYLKISKHFFNERKINSRLKKAKLSDAVVIRIAEPKLHSYILNSDIQLDNYQVLHFDRNRKGGLVTSYIRTGLCYIENKYFPEEIENIFFQILPQNTFAFNFRNHLSTLDVFLQTLNGNFVKLILWKKSYTFSKT